MGESAEALADRLSAEISAATDLKALEGLRVAALGRNGVLTERLKRLGSLAPGERRAAGVALNRAKDVLSAALAERRAALESAAQDAALAAEAIDVSLPTEGLALGRLHPTQRVLEELISMFGSRGYAIAQGPDIDSAWHAFTALNIPSWHPARQEMDTFYVGPETHLHDDKKRMVLRPHTSTVQIRTMLDAPPPYRIVAPGRVFRADSDATHIPMFHQLEALVIDRDLHMGHLRGAIQDFVRGFFGIKDLPVRFRPSHFPFTEPSAEVDIGCRRDSSGFVLGHSSSDSEEWLEILGCGMVHPKVLQNCGADPEVWQGFAWGIGVDRLAALKYGAADLRLFMEGDLGWMRQYGFLPLAHTDSVWGG